MQGNEAVYAFAKQAARQNRAPWCQVQAVRHAGRRLCELAIWIGRMTAMANSFPDPAGGDGRVRETEARACRSTGREWPAKRKAAHLDAPSLEVGGMWATPHMAAVRQRVLARLAAAAAGCAAGPVLGR